MTKPPAPDWFVDMIMYAAGHKYENMVMRVEDDETIVREAYEKLLSYSQTILYLGDQYRVIFLEAVEDAQD